MNTSYHLKIDNKSHQERALLSNFVLEECQETPSDFDRLDLVNRVVTAVLQCILCGVIDTTSPSTRAVESNDTIYQLPLMAVRELYRIHSAANHIMGEIWIQKQKDDMPLREDDTKQNEDAEEIYTPQLKLNLSLEGCKGFLVILISAIEQHCMLPSGLHVGNRTKQSKSWWWKSRAQWELLSFARYCCDTIKKSSDFFCEGENSHFNHRMHPLEVMLRLFKYQACGFIARGQRQEDDQSKHESTPSNITTVFGLVEHWTRAYHDTNQFLSIWFCIPMKWRRSLFPIRLVPPNQMILAS